jgi:hypothetical protein
MKGVRGKLSSLGAPCAILFASFCLPEHHVLIFNYIASLLSAQLEILQEEAERLGQIVTLVQEIEILIRTLLCLGESTFCVREVLLAEQD